MKCSAPYHMKPCLFVENLSVALTIIECVFEIKVRFQEQGEETRVAAIPLPLRRTANNKHSYAVSSRIGYIQ